MHFFRNIRTFQFLGLILYSALELVSCVKIKSGKVTTETTPTGGSWGTLSAKFIPSQQIVTELLTPQKPGRKSSRGKKGKKCPR